MVRTYIFYIQEEIRTSKCDGSGESDVIAGEGIHLLPDIYALAKSIISPPPPTTDMPTFLLMNSYVLNIGRYQQATIPIQFVYKP